MPGMLRIIFVASVPGKVSLSENIFFFVNFQSKIKLALYLYALVRLLGGRSKAENSAAGLDRFPVYLGGIWLLCAVLRKIDLDTALPLRSALTWGFVLLTWIGGGAACLYRSIRRC